MVINGDETNSETYIVIKPIVSNIMIQNGISPTNSNQNVSLPEGKSW